MSIFYSYYYGCGYNPCVGYKYNCYEPNIAPIAKNDCFSGCEDQPVVIAVANLLSNDSDKDHDKLTLTSVQGALNGTVSLVNGTVTFKPIANYNGPASFTYTVSDGNGGTSTATVNLSISPINDRPDAVNDNITVTAPGKVTIDPATLLANDQDVDGDKLTITSVQCATHGTVALVNGKVVFTPDAGYSGPATFTYTISDGKGGCGSASSDTATVCLTIPKDNTAPDAVNDSVIGQEDHAFVINMATLLANDTDANGDKLTVTSVQAGVHGAVAIVSGQVVFTPDANYNGPASFTYTISDGKGGTDTATVSLNINPENDAPDAVNDGVIAGKEDTSLAINFATLLANDTDIDGDKLTITSVQAGVHGTVAIVSGQVVFTPDANYNGPASFTYTISDGNGGVDTATVNLNIVPVDDAPVLGNSSVTVSEEGLVNGIVDAVGNPTDTTNVTVVTGSVAVSDSDSATLAVTLVAPTEQYSSHGTLVSWSGAGTNTLVGTAGSVTVATLTINDSGHYNFTLTGTLDHPDMTSEDVLNLQFGVKASDGTSSTLGTITVTVEDDAPSALAQQVDLVESTNVNVMIVLDTSGSMATNDGINGQTRLLTATQSIVKLLDQYDTTSNVMVRLVTFSTNASALANEWVTVAAAKLLLNDIIASGGTNYDEALGDAATAFADPGKLTNAQNVSYFFSDGAPTYGSGTTDELTPAGQSPGTPAVNGTGYDQSGADTGIQVSEEQAWKDFLSANHVKSYALGIGSGIANPAYLDPVAYNGQAQTDMSGLLVNDFNQLDGVLVNSIKEVNGQLITGAYAFGADGGYVESIKVGNETYSFNSNTGAITQVGGASTYTYNATTHVLTVTTSVGGKFTVDMDNGIYSYTPANGSANQPNDVITFKLVDGDGDYSASTITFVKPFVNNLPEATNDSGITGNEDTPLTINFATLLANDKDVDGDTLTISSVQAGENGSVAIVNGQVVFTPTAHYNGPASFTYTVADGNGGFNTATVSLNIAAAIHNVEVASVSVNVSEEGLVGGLQDTTGNPDTTNASSIEGNLQISNAPGNLTITLSQPSEVLTSGGVAVTWLGSGTQQLTAMAGTHAVATVSVDNSGHYAFKLLAPVDHSGVNIEDVKTINFGVNVADGVTSTTSTLTVSIEDDSPIAINKSDSFAMIDTNLLITLDTSNSMNDVSGINAETRLQSAVNSIERLMDIYDGFGETRVRLVTFSSNAETQGTEWVTLSAAKTILDGILTTGGTTNYDGAIANAMTAFTDPGKISGAQNISYFFSDGNPNRADGSNTTLSNVGSSVGPDNGIQVAEEAIWKDFLKVNQIKSYAIGMGAGLTDVSYLNPIAYDGQARQDVNGVVVTEMGQLDGVLASTVNAFPGQLLSGGLLAAHSGVGADGGYVKSITVESVTYAFDPVTDTVSNATNGLMHFDTVTRQLTVTLSSGGHFMVDMDEGTYQYQAPAVLSNAIAEHFDYVIVDKDGDQAAATVTFDVDRANVTIGTTGADTLIGVAGPDVILGREGDDILIGGGGKDDLLGGDGDDTLIGGAGFDTMSGGLGADTFVWALADAGVKGNPAIDIVTDFDVASKAAGGDVLDLRDLLVGENHASGIGNLASFLHFEKAGADTVVHVSATGEFAGGFNAANDVQTITLLNVDLITSFANDQAVIQDLLTKNKLTVD